MKTFVKRILAVVMALTMALSLFAVSASAMTLEKSKKKYNNVVYMGDSIAAGYGLNGEASVLNLANQFTLHHGEIVPGSYPALVNKAVGATKTFNMSRESFTAMNYLRFLDPEYEEEVSQPANYYDRFLTECTTILPKMTSTNLSDMQYLRDNAESVVANADAIIFNLGNNDTFTMALLDPYFRTLYYTYGMVGQIPLTLLKGQYKLPATFEDVVRMFGGYQLLLDAIDSYTAKFEANCERLMKRIRQLNPKCDIYYIGMYNTFRDVGPDDGLFGALRSFLYENGIDLTNELQDFATRRASFRNDVTYVDVANTETHYIGDVNSPFYYMEFLVGCHPSPAGHLYMANQIIDAMNKKATNMFDLTKGEQGWGIYSSFGRLRKNVTALARKSDGTVYYVKNGLVATDYTGIVTQDGKKYYIANGKWDKSYTGTLKTRTKVYTIQNGVVTRTVNR